VHHVGILYDQFMMHGQRNIKLWNPFFWQGNVLNSCYENFAINDRGKQAGYLRNWMAPKTNFIPAVYIYLFHFLINLIGSKKDVYL